ncbi:MAG: hypothetical protein JWN44_859, partial [Myxococcales bacterium]|nr:hypothetical protein [Myxococcales bacterium]
VCWDLAQYKRILDAANAEGDDWYVAVCLRGGPESWTTR